MLQEAYRSDPRSYPELRRYATFLHGVRKVDISFGFMDYYRFFEVTVGDFAIQKRRTMQKMTYSVFEQIPFLDQVSTVVSPTDMAQIIDASLDCCSSSGRSSPMAQSRARARVSLKVFQAMLTLDLLMTGALYSTPRSHALVWSAGYFTSASLKRLRPMRESKLWIF